MLGPMDSLLGLFAAVAIPGVAGAVVGIMLRSLKDARDR